MKKVFVIMFSVALLSAMTACTSRSGNENSEQAPVSQTDEEKGSETEQITSGETELSPEDSGEETVSEESGSNQTEGSRILVAYFSRVGNMDYEEGVDAVTSASVNIEEDGIFGNAQLLAQMAQEITGGDLFFIETAEKYPAVYRETTDLAKEEQDNDARPELVSHVEDMDSYDTVILVFPIWWGTLPHPVFTFLEEYDFSGKTIWLLCTHEGSRMGRSESDIAELAPDAHLAEGLAVRGSDAGSSRADVEAWLSDLKISE